MTPRLAATFAAGLLVGACSASGETTTTSPAATSTQATSASDPRPGTTSTTSTTTVTPTGAPTTPGTATPAPPVTSSAPSTEIPTSEVPTSDSIAPPVIDASGQFTETETNDRDVARTALITLSVFPDGWVEDPIDDDDDPGTDEFEAEFDICLGRDDAVRVGDDLDRLKVGTGEFHPAGDHATTVSHEVVLAPDVDTALAAMAEVRIDGAERCLADVIGDFYRSSFADDPVLAEVGVGDVIVTRTEDDRDPDIAVGVLLEVPLTIGDQSVSQFLELQYQRHGRALSELSFSSFGARFSRDEYTVLSDEAAIGLAAIGT